MTSALHTRVCELLGCRYPIIQTGMGWVSGARLTHSYVRVGVPPVAAQSRRSGFRRTSPTITSAARRLISS